MSAEEPQPGSDRIASPAPAPVGPVPLFKPKTVLPPQPIATLAPASSLPSPTPEGPSSSDKVLLYFGIAAGVSVLLLLVWWFGIHQPGERERLAEIAMQEAIEREKDAEAKSAQDSQEKAQLEDQAKTAEEEAEKLKTANEKMAEDQQDKPRTDPDTQTDAAQTEMTPKTDDDKPAADAPAKTDPDAQAAKDAQDALAQRNQSLDAFLQQWREHNASNDPAVWAADFAPQVDYCYKSPGYATPDDIEADRKTLTDKWTDRKYTFNSVTWKWVTEQKAEAKINYSYDYNDGVKTGTSDVTLVIESDGTDWRITSYQETVHRQ